MMMMMMIGVDAKSVLKFFLIKYLFKYLDK